MEPGKSIVTIFVTKPENQTKPLFKMLVIQNDKHGRTQFTLSGSLRNP
jgi:hypothetical protein